MKEFYFASTIHSLGTLSRIEREIRTECEGYLNRIVSHDHVLEIVEDLEDIQKRVLSKYPHSAPAKIRKEKSEEGDMSIRFGKSTLFLRLVKGSYKEAAASELFNDGWWNCFDSFVEELSHTESPDHLREICEEILMAAGVTSSEAFMRSETLTNQTAKDVAEYYANLIIIE